MVAHPFLPLTDCRRETLKLVYKYMCCAGCVDLNTIARLLSGTELQRYLLSRSFYCIQLYVICHIKQGLFILTPWQAQSWSCSEYFCVFLGLHLLEQGCWRRCIQLPLNLSTNDTQNKALKTIENVVQINVETQI